MIVLGVDPGLSGALCVIESDDLHVVDVMDMPVIGKELDYGLLYIFLEDWRPKRAIIERAQAMPKQGVVGMFNYGYLYGELNGVMKALRVSYDRVTPQAWKKTQLVGMPKGKVSSVIRVNQLYPELKLRKTQHGRADCILIARHGCSKEEK